MRGFGLLLVAALTGCSGAGSAPSGTVTAARATSAPASAAAHSARRVSLQLTIPGPALAAQRRLPRYTPAVTATANVTVNGGTAQSFNVSNGSSLCTAAGSGRLCVLTVAAPAGADTILLQLLDGSSNVLSASTFSTTVTADVGNVSVPVTLGGVPATMDIDFASPSTYVQPNASATPVSLPLVVTVKDASGTIITGNAPFVNAQGNAMTITATTDQSAGTWTTTGTNNATTASGFTFGAPSDTLSVRYGLTTAPRPDGITITSTGVTRTGGATSFLFGPGIGPQSMAFQATDVLGMTVDTNAGYSGLVYTDGAYRLGYFGFGTLFNSVCSVTSPLSGNVTAIRGMTMDTNASGGDPNIYLSTNTNTSGYYVLSESVASVGVGGTCNYGNVSASYGSMQYGAIAGAASGVEVSLSDGTTNSIYAFGAPNVNSAGPGLNGSYPQNTSSGRASLDGASIAFAEGSSIAVLSNTGGAAITAPAPAGVLGVGIAADGSSIFAVSSSNIYQEDTRSGSSFNAVGSSTLSSPLVTPGSGSDVRLVVGAPYAGKYAGYVLTNAGIAVFRAGTPSAPDVTYTLPATAVACDVADDKRVWCALSNSSLVGLPVR